MAHLGPRRADLGENRADIGADARSVAVVDADRERDEIGRQRADRAAVVRGARAEAGAPGQFSYNVFAVSRSDFERIRQAHLDYFRLLRSIVSESTPEEVVVVANVQLFPLDEPH